MVKIDMDLSGLKVPKTVAGVKVPKKLRKRGKKLIAKAQETIASPQGREAIAAGLTIAGTVLAASARAKAAKPARAADDAPASPRRPGEPGIAPGDALGHQLGDALAAGIGALQTFLAGSRR